MSPESVYDHYRIYFALVLHFTAFGLRFLSSHELILDHSFSFSLTMTLPSADGDFFLLPYNRQTALQSEMMVAKKFVLHWLKEMSIIQMGMLLHKPNSWNRFERTWGNFLGTVSHHVTAAGTLCLAI